MDMTVGELAESIGGRLTDEGVAARKVGAIRSLGQAGEDDVSFYRGDPRYLPQVRSTRAAAVVSESPVEGAARPFIIVEDAELAVSFLLAAVRDLQNPPPPPGVHPRAFVDPEAVIGEGAAIGPFAVVEAGARIGARSRLAAHTFVGRGAVLGEECVLHPGAVVLHNCELGARVILWSGAVIGRDGFGFFQREGRHLRNPQTGGVVLGDDVEVGSWSSVDRGAVDPTIVGRGVKIDSHCHVAHNCRVGEDSLLIGYARLGGSATVGKNAILAQESAVGERRTAGDGAILASGARALYKDVGPGEMVLGFPARPFTHQKRIDVVTDRLPDMYAELRALRKRVESLEGGRAKP